MMFDSLLETSRLLGVIGLALIIIEIAVLGFSTLFLLFVGLGCLGTAVLIGLSILPDNWLYAILATAVQSAIWWFFLWKPLKNMQHRQQTPHDQPSGFGHIEFILESDVTEEAFSEHTYSGIRWTVKLSEGVPPLTQGTPVRVTKSEVGVLWVEPKNGVEPK